MSRFYLSAGLCLALLVSTARVSLGERPFPAEADRILFLGDSITHAGHYISIIEKELRLKYSSDVPELINLGLPSETCSGLSEPDHPFPRPDVRERVKRALKKVSPDVVVICYGMNDGIYYPFSEERFEKYKEGLRYTFEQVQGTGARVILMTPPAFDPLPLKKQGKLLPDGAEKYAWFSIYENYDDVLKQYSAWVMTLKNEVDLVIDLHTPVNDYVRAKRQQDSEFTMSPDGVHVNEEGHEVLAKTILKAWQIEPSGIEDPAVESLIHRRQMLLHASWVSEVGHKRPGVKAGLPLEEAIASAREMESEIEDRMVRLRPLMDQSEGKIHHLYYPASKVENELSLAADYYLWVPPGVEKLRGVIVHQHGCGDGASKGGATAANDLHWRELARKWDCALLGTSYEARQGTECRAWCDPRRGSAQRFLQALEDFATETGHAELSQVPWCLWGHSGGGFWASIMQGLYPERIVGIFLQSGQAFSRWTTGEIPMLVVPESAYDIPVVACPGFKEKGDKRFHVAWDGCLAMFQAYRKKNAPIIFAPDPRTGHECGDSRYFAIPFFDVCLELRLPENSSDSQLRKLDMSSGYLVDLEGQKVGKVGSFTGAQEQTVWFPTLELVEQWRQFLKTGTVEDATPPATPTAIRLAVLPEKRLRVSWHAKVDFESGIGGFRIKQGGRVIASLPEKPNRRFGRPLFQGMSYHDTPEQPLPAMSIELDLSQVDGTELQLVSVNGAGLESAPVMFEVTQ